MRTCCSHKSYSSCACCFFLFLIRILIPCIDANWTNYIYIEREREEGERNVMWCVSVWVCMCVWGVRYANRDRWSLMSGRIYYIINIEWLNFEQLFNFDDQFYCCCCWVVSLFSCFFFTWTIFHLRVVGFVYDPLIILLVWFCFNVYYILHTHLLASKKKK